MVEHPSNAPASANTSTNASRRMTTTKDPNHCSVMTVTSSNIHRPVPSQPRFTRRAPSLAA